MYIYISLLIYTLIVSLISPGSHVVSAPTIISISLLACDGRRRNDFKANSIEFCKEGSPAGVICCILCTSYK